MFLRNGIRGTRGLDDDTCATSLQDHNAARRIAYHSPGFSILSIHYTSLEASLSDKIRTNGLAMTHTAVSSRVMSSTPLTFYV